MTAVRSLRTALAVPRWINAQVRSYASTTRVGMRLAYTDHGAPEDVIQLEKYAVRDPGSDDVLVKMMYAPVNPSDVNQIQGTYPTFAEIDTDGKRVGGNEGVGIVAKVGSNVSCLSVGQRVISMRGGHGTWQTHVTCPAAHFIESPEDAPDELAATIKVNPATAYRMLHDFCELHPGDTVIQNASNSGVGHAVVQIAKQMGVNTINIVRGSEKNTEGVVVPRADLSEITAELKALGATEVLTDKDARDKSVHEYFKSKYSKPRIGLNCVGGSMATDVIKLMDNRSTLVTYGAMSHRPFSLSASTLIFKDIRAVGYWQTRWYDEHDNNEAQRMFKEIANMRLKTSVNKRTLKGWWAAITEAQMGYRGPKVVLDLRK